METFSRNLAVNVIYVDASRQFLEQLKGITDPEQKRRTIGREFVEIFQQEAAKLKTSNGWRKAPFIRMSLNLPAATQRNQD